MTMLSYPLVCWQLDEASVCGILLGTDHQLIERNVRRLKAALAETLQRERDRDGHVPEPDISQARLRLAHVSVSLAHRTDKGNFPEPCATDFHVASVYGQNEEDGYSKCYLPWLDQSFYYYDEAQLPALIEHYTRERLDGLSPEQAQLYLMPSAPWLEAISIRGEQRAASGPQTPRHLRETFARLAVVADRLPYSAARRSLHVFPEVAWEQTALVDEMAARLASRGNVLLVGEPGVGKSVVILEAIRKAHRATTGRDGQPTFWRSHAERLIGRARYLGEWQQLCDQVVQWLDMAGGLLWVTDFVNLLQVGGRSAEESMAAYLLPSLRAGKLRLVGELNPGELETARQRLPGFVDCFETMSLPEMDNQRARRVMELFAAQAKNALSVEIERQALDTGYRLLQRYVRHECFPGKAVRFFGDCAREALAAAGGAQSDAAIVSERAVIAHFAKTTGLPETFLRDDQPLDDARLQAFFARKLLGQDGVIAHLKEVVYLFKAGLNDPAKPIATLLFAGPTGVGKTAAVKALASYFFGAGSGADPLFRLDMSEFQHAFQIARLIGSGDKPGKLIEHVRRQPFSVVLLDEIEKADVSVFDMLLGVLDEGRLRDSLGRVTDFRSTVIVMTTNLGVRHRDAAGFARGADDDGSAYMHEIRQFFRPEFFNRIDRIVPFVSLTRPVIEALAVQELQAIELREGLARRGVRLNFSPQVIAFVVDKGFSPKYGARPLQRAVEKYVVAAVARAMLGLVPEHGWLDVVMQGDAVLASARTS